MNPVSPARRRADEFSAMVEAASTTRLADTGTPGATGRHDAELASLVGIVTSLRTTPPPVARPEFVADLRGRLLLAAEQALAPDTAEQVEARRQPARRRTARERRLAVAVGGFALVSASASMSVAAQTALPGDTLYPLKRALESIHEGVLRDPDDKGATMLGNASGRLDEVDQLARTGEQDPGVIAETLQDFTDQAVEASDVILGDYEATGDPTSVEELQTFTAASLEALRRLQDVVPVEARTSLIKAARVLDRIRRQALEACPTCADVPGLDDALSAADLGPLFEVVDAAPEATPPSPPKPQGDGDPKSPPAGNSDPAPEPAPEEAPGTDDTEQPGLPQGPGGGQDRPPGGGDDPLGEVVTNLDVPLGEVLTGVVDTADELLPGADGPAGGGKK